MKQAYFITRILSSDIENRSSYSCRYWHKILVLWFASMFSFYNKVQLQAQVPEVDIQNSRLLVNSGIIDIHGKSNNAILINFLPHFSHKNVLLPWRDNFKIAKHSQKNKVFNFQNRKWAYIENGTELYYQNKKTHLVGSFAFGEYPYSEVFQSSKNHFSSNCFYLVNTSYFSPDWNSIVDMYLHLQSFCVNVNGTIDKQMLQTIYMGRVNGSNYSGTLTGWKAISAEDGVNYFHVFNPLDTNLHIYKLQNDKLVEINKYFYPELQYIDDINISANSRILILNNDNPSLTRPVPHNAREIYIHTIEDGCKISSSPDTIRPFTFDTAVNDIVKFSFTQLSPTGRFLYITETVWNKNPITEVKFGENSITWASEDKARLLQVDLAGMGQPGFRPTPKIIKEWQKSGHSFRVFPHTVPVDGKLYFSVEEVKINPKDYCDTSISFWRLNNIETDTVTFSSAELMIDNLEFPVTFRDPDIFDPKTWAQYPYHAYSDTGCASEKTSVWISSTINYDSIIWAYDTLIKSTMYAPDTLAQLILPAGRHAIKCYVYRGGYEDVLYQDVNVKTAANSFNNLRTLPKVAYGCQGNNIILDPGIDTLAVKQDWVDGTPGTNRIINKSGKYIWRTYYQNTPCPRLDTVEVVFTDWSQIKLSGAAKCDTVAVTMYVEGIKPHMRYKWPNGDSTSFINTVINSGRYCITVTDTLSKCNTQVCENVNLLKSVAPSWAGKDTVICDGETIEIKQDVGYELQCAEGTEQRDGICIISKPGNYIFKYRQRTQPQNLCSWKEANISVSFAAHGVAEFCPQESDCQWYIPNAFTPDRNNLNEQWFPVSTCPESTYSVIVFNRWGEQVYHGESKGWSGKVFGGTIAPEGVYFYIVVGKQPDLKTVYRSGTIHLLR